MTHQEYVCEGMIKRDDIVTMLESFENSIQQIRLACRRTLDASGRLSRRADQCNPRIRGFAEHRRSVWARQPDPKYCTYKNGGPGRPPKGSSKEGPPDQTKEDDPMPRDNAEKRTQGLLDRAEVFYLVRFESLCRDIPDWDGLVWSALTCRHHPCRLRGLMASSRISPTP